jgi:Holliday junction resolvasome RuvABC endonuclease subunit
MAPTAKKIDTLLALDPGLRELGYAILEGSRLLTHGVLPLRSVPKAERLSRIRESFRAWMRGYEPDTLVLEDIPKRPLDHLGGLPALGRSLKRLASEFWLEQATYSARAVRQSVVGDGWAGKRETAESVCAVFPDLRVYLTQDRKWKEAHWQNMFDAVALGLHHQAVTTPPSRSR